MFLKRTGSMILAILLLFGCAPVRAGNEKVSSLQEFAAVAEEYAARLETSFSIPCEWSLTEELKKSSSVGKGITLLSEIMIRAGCGPYSVAWYDDHVQLSGLAYYAGWIILRRWQTGTTDLLSPREQMTLAQALSLTAGASGSDLEKERYIYDALCARITYDTRDDGTGDKDCAIGALLNGRADCDGYSDAMMLCCGLAGIPCRYIHGDSVIPVHSGSGTQSHLWNLVYIEGSWLMCDVTWGDQDRGDPCYLYFNIGRRDASLSYHWNTDTQFSGIASLADFSTQLMPDQQPAVICTPEDVRLAARTAVSAGQRHLMLYCPEEVFWQTDPDGFREMLGRGAVHSFYSHESGRLYEISGISVPDRFCFCDTEEDAVQYIRSVRDNGESSLRIYCSDALFDDLVADNAARFFGLLSREGFSGWTVSCAEPYRVLAAEGPK